MADETNPGIEIDLAAIEAELDQLSPEQLAAELLKVRTRQKTQQKKMQGSPSHKAYQKKAQEKRKLLIAKAKALGIYDTVNEQAEEAAKIAYSKLQEADAETETDETETAETETEVS